MEKTPLQKVVDILVDYYGEDRVDLQGTGAILIYFPHVTVTNENNRSIDITELYARILVDELGKLSGTFTLNRAEYSVDQWHSNYMHSHINGIQKDSLSTFKTPCLGAGPIQYTCATLNGEFDEDIWRLFALELDKYVHTESLAGVPYKYLERVTSPGISPSSRTLSIMESIWRPTDCQNTPTLLLGFLPFLIEKRPFRFGFNNGKYFIADSPYDIVVRMSNLFIEWYNNLPVSEQGTIKNDMFSADSLIVCKNSGNNIIMKQDYSQYNYTQFRREIGRELWTFKGRRLRLNITGIPEDGNTPIIYDENTSILLHPSVVMYLVNKMLKVINYKYGKTTASEPGQEEFYL